MTLAEFARNLYDGWLVVASIILALMVLATVREEWQAPDGNRVEVVGGLALIALGIYLGGFR